MNVNKIVKLSSNQGGNFTAQNNLVDFTIPANTGIYDLSKSYVNLDCSVSQANNTNNVVAVPIIDLLKEDGATPHRSVMDNVCLVKNVSLNCANRGSIADIRRVDMLRNNMNQYLQSSDNLDSKNYKLFNTPIGDSQQTNSIFRELRKEGDGISKIVSAPIRIPLSDLVGFGKVKAYDTERYGRTNLHLELNLDKVQVRQYLDDTAANWARATTRTNTQMNTFQDLSATKGAALKTLFWSYGDTNAGERLTRLQECPFYVGQALAVSATAGGGRGGGNLADVAVQIVSITHRRGSITDATQAGVELTLNTAISAGGDLTAGETYTGITCVGVANTMTFNCDSAELVLEQVMNPVKVADKLQYTEFSTEEHNANGVQNFQRQFQCEPEAINLYVFRADEMFSRNVNNGIQNYRIRVNNEDATNRQVVYQRPLYYDRINMCFVNSGKQVKNLNEKVLELNDADANIRLNSLARFQNPANNDLVLVCNPLPFSQMEKQVQVNITSSGATLNNIVLYKELLKSI